MGSRTDPATNLYFGWNGISMQIPPSWEPVVVLTDYLLFEDRCRPVLELKWQQAGTALAPHKIITRLRRNAGRSETVQPWDIPQQWEQALPQFDTLGFQWQEGDTSGKGLLLHCPSCEKNILLQFYGRQPENESDCLHLLQSLSDHPKTPPPAEIHWAIYDIDFMLPDRAVLREHKFLTGSYTISFELDGLFISLLRLKPAAILLQDTNLQTLAGRLLKRGRPYNLPEDPPRTVCLQTTADSWQRFKAKLRRQQADNCLLLRHLPAKNVLLGLQAKGNRPLEPATLLPLFNNYTAR